MKRLLKVYVSDDLLDAIDDFTNSDYRSIQVSAFDYDFICSNPYVSNFDEEGDSCDDNDVTIVEHRYYYHRDFPYSYCDKEFYLVTMKEGE